MTTTRAFAALVASVLAVFLGVFAAPSIAAADVDDFAFESLDADYTLTRDDDGVSRLRVVERFVAIFPDADQNHGMRRVIPDSRQGEPMRPSLESVVDETGEEWDVETDDIDGGLEVVARKDDFVRGRQVFVFTYTLDNVTQDFADTGTELYLDVNGTDWRQPFGTVTATVHLAPALSDAMGETACYAGAFRSGVACDGIDLEESGEGATVTARQADLAPGETLTVAVGFADGTFTPLDTSYVRSPWLWAQLAAFVALLAATVWAIAVRRTTLRNAPGRPTVVAEFGPPPGVDALEAAVFLSKTGKAIPAEVLEQAIVGSIRLLSSEESKGKAKLVAELIDRSRADRDGRMLLDALFPSGAPGDTYEFGSQDTRVSTRAQKILAEAGTALKARGLFRRVSVWARLGPLLVGLAAAVVVLVCSASMLDAAVDPLWPVTLLIAAPLLLVVAIVCLVHTPLSADGAEVRDHLAGLRQFIEWAEADRIRMLQSPDGAERVAVDVGDPRQMLALYEALLPYAVVFGQEKEWASQLAVLYENTQTMTPTWYAGAAAFNVSSFSAGIGSLSVAAASSSSSGGSTGGGFAGGGAGGGGGGGV